MNRIWCFAALKGSATIAFGADIGTLVLKLGSEESVCSLTSLGKLIYSKAGSKEILSANIRVGQISKSKDGEFTNLNNRSLGIIAK